MSTLIQRTFVLSAAALLCSARAVADPPAFAKLVPLPAPRIVASAEDYPGGGFTPEKLLDGDVNSAFATNGKGTDTFVEFDFGQTVRVAAFQHVDRNDPATVAVSQLTLFDGDGRAVATPSVKHVNKPGRHHLLRPAATDRRADACAGRSPRWVIATRPWAARKSPSSPPANPNPCRRPSMSRFAPSRSSSELRPATSNPSNCCSTTPMPRRSTPWSASRDLNRSPSTSSSARTGYVTPRACHRRGSSPADHDRVRRANGCFDAKRP